MSGCDGVRDTLIPAAATQRATKLPSLHLTQHLTNWLEVIERS